MSNTGAEWSEKYLLPSSYDAPCLSEVLGVCLGEEAVSLNWWVEDNLFNEEENIDA